MVKTSNENEELCDLQTAGNLKTIMNEYINLYYLKLKTSGCIYVIMGKVTKFKGSSEPLICFAFDHVH